MQDLLPIGSIVYLQDKKWRVMISGYGHRSLQSGKLYDYIGVPWPNGFIGAQYGLMFNAGDIAQVLQIGYQDADSVSFEESMTKALSGLRQQETGGK